jgi:hypothetical protein
MQKKKTVCLSKYFIEMFGNDLGEWQLQYNWNIVESGIKHQ